jgi:polyisoprenoid-binding protein YceI
MKRLAFATAILALAAPLALAQTSTWATDPAHSGVDFSIRHMGLSNVHGGFSKVTGTIQLNEADIARSTVQVTIDVGTVDTGNSGRDTDLKSDHFFDVAKFPTATFTSTSVARNGSNLSVIGNLTLKGVTKPVVLQVEGPDGPITGMDHKLHAGYSATTTISRLAYGVGSSYPSSMLGDDIKLTIEIEAVKQ